MRKEAEILREKLLYFVISYVPIEDRKYP